MTATATMYRNADIRVRVRPSRQFGGWIAEVEDLDGNIIYRSPTPWRTEAGARFDLQVWRAGNVEGPS